MKKIKDINSLITTNIINKYKGGITFVDAEWTGNPDLKLRDNFVAKSHYDENEAVGLYECLSNEFKLTSNFRQKTKGRQLCKGFKNLS